MAVMALGLFLFMRCTNKNSLFYCLQWPFSAGLPAFHPLPSAFGFTASLF
jgi:hypothetical protein